MNSPGGIPPTAGGHDAAANGRASTATVSSAAFATTVPSWGVTGSTAAEKGRTRIGPLPQRPRLREVLGPSSGLLVGFVLLLVALIGAFSYVVVHFQSQSKSQARERFAQRARLTADFTGSLLETSETGAEAAAAKTFGAATTDTKKLTAAARRGGLAYLVLLDSRGGRLAASAGAPSNAAALSSPQVRHALAGHAWLSGLAASGRSPTIEWAQPFDTPYGRRVEVEGFPARLLGSFLNAFLRKSSLAASGASFVVDGAGRILAASTATAGVGSRPSALGLATELRTRRAGVYRYGGADRYFASARIAGSGWRAVTVTTTAALYPAIAGSDSWILYAALAVFAAVSATSVFFFRRALVQGDALRRTNGELISMNATLEERVADRTMAAEERARDLARSNAELEEFSSVASHDLQEPLRKVRMFGERLQTRLGDSVSDEAASDLERMRDAAERMQRLINDLLAFSRVTYRGEGFEPVDLSEVAAEVVSDIEPRIVELDAVVNVDQLPTLEADRTQMRQLLQNLISNALKFHKPDEAPIVHVRCQPPVVTTAYGGDGSGTYAKCAIIVEDNGIGFDEKHAERIFGAFERLHGRSAYEGTGIGLAIARKIARRHGGDIDASGTPGEGAAFTVTLPFVQASKRHGGRRP